MLGNGRSTRCEASGKLTHAGVPDHQAIQNPAARGVREGAKDLRLEGSCRIRFDLFSHHILTSYSDIVLSVINDRFFL